MKNAAANDKLKKMVKDQQEAEKKKVPLPVPGTVAYVGRPSPSLGFVCVSPPSDPTCHHRDPPWLGDGNQSAARGQKTVWRMPAWHLSTQSGGPGCPSVCLLIHQPCWPK